jgi:hypothetical protein
MKIDLSDLVSQREAAEMRGVTVQAIHFLVKRGRFTIIEVSGKTFLLRKEVEDYKPSAGGRPRKGSTTKASRNPKTTKRGGASKTKSSKKKKPKS